MSLSSLDSLRVATIGAELVEAINDYMSQRKSNAGQLFYECIKEVFKNATDEKKGLLGEIMAAALLFVLLDSEYDVHFLDSGLPRSITDETRQKMLKEYEWFSRIRPDDNIKGRSFDLLLIERGVKEHREIHIAQAKWGNPHYAKTVNAIIQNRELQMNMLDGSLSVWFVNIVTNVPNPEIDDISLKGNIKIVDTKHQILEYPTIDELHRLESNIEMITTPIVDQQRRGYSRQQKIIPRWPTEAVLRECSLLFQARHKKSEPALGRKQFSIIHTTGTGKTFTLAELLSHEGFQPVSSGALNIVFVPSLILMKQTYQKFKRYFRHREGLDDDFKSSVTYYFMCCLSSLEDEVGNSGDIIKILFEKDEDSHVNFDGNARMQMECFRKNTSTKILFCTYHSSWMLVQILAQIGQEIEIGFVFYDEVHESSGDRWSMRKAAHLVKGLINVAATATPVMKVAQSNCEKINSQHANDIKEGFLEGVEKSQMDLDAAEGVSDEEEDGDPEDGCQDIVDSGVQQVKLNENLFGSNSIMFIQESELEQYQTCTLGQRIENLNRTHFPLEQRKSSHDLLVASYFLHEAKMCPETLNCPAFYSQLYGECLPEAFDARNLPYCMKLGDRWVIKMRKCQGEDGGAQWHLMSDQVTFCKDKDGNFYRGTGITRQKFIQEHLNIPPEILEGELVGCQALGKDYSFDLDDMTSYPILHAVSLSQGLRENVIVPMNLYIESIDEIYIETLDSKKRYTKGIHDREALVSGICLLNIFVDDFNLSRNMILCKVCVNRKMEGSLSRSGTCLEPRWYLSHGPNVCSECSSVGHVYSPERHCLIKCGSISEVRRCTDLLKNLIKDWYHEPNNVPELITVQELHSEQSRVQRRQAINHFKASSFSIMVVCMMGITGLDIQKIDTLMLWMSKACDPRVMDQFMGRGRRKIDPVISHHENYGKLSCDFVVSTMYTITRGNQKKGQNQAENEHFASRLSSDDLATVAQILYVSKVEDDNIFCARRSGKRSSRGCSSVNDISVEEWPARDKMIPLLEEARVRTTRSDDYFESLVRDVHIWRKSVSGESPRLPKFWGSAGGEGGVGRRICTEAKRQLGVYSTPRTDEQLKQLTDALGFEEGYEWWMQLSQNRDENLIEEIRKWRSTLQEEPIPRVPDVGKNEGGIGKRLSDLSYKVRNSMDYMNKKKRILESIAEALGFDRGYRWWEDYALNEIIPTNILEDDEMIRRLFSRWQGKDENRFNFPLHGDTVDLTESEQRQYAVEEKAIRIGQRLYSDAEQFKQEMKDNTNTQHRLALYIDALGFKSMTPQDFADRVCRSHMRIRSLKMPECPTEVLWVFEKWLHWKTCNRINRRWPRHREIFKIREDNTEKEYGLGFYLNQKLKDAKGIGRNRASAISILVNLARILTLEHGWWESVKPFDDGRNDNSRKRKSA